MSLRSCEGHFTHNVSDLQRNGAKRRKTSNGITQCPTVWTTTMPNGQKQQGGRQKNVSLTGRWPWTNGGTERMDRLSLNIFTSLYSTVGSEFLTTIQLLSYNGDSATSWCLPASQTKFITLWQIYCSHWFIVGVATMKPYLTREGFQLGRCCGAATSH